MKIAVLGLGVIGTIYAYAFQKAGHSVKHIVREEKINNTPAAISVHLLDGRYRARGEEREDFYKVSLAERGECFDFILVSVANGKLADALQTIRSRQIQGVILFFCNFWFDRGTVDSLTGDFPYIIAFPTAGGRLENDLLDCVLFDHIMLEREETAHASNYKLLVKLLRSADIKAELPYDMLEWIWIHMAINAGVCSTAARHGRIEDPAQLARDLMGDSKALALAVRTIRETLKVVRGRGVNLKQYRNELWAYKLPARIAGISMKKLFARNKLSSRIMTLHNDVDDIMYVCKCVYDESLNQHLQLPLFYQNLKKFPL